MAQLRLTKKFASDCHIQSLQKPQQTLALLDDWVIDVMLIARHKVAIITHVTTFYTMLIPYAHVGGAKKISTSIPSLLRALLQGNSGLNDIDELDELFNKASLRFCKTDNRQVIGHMNDFKRCIEAQTYDVPFDHIDWDCLIKYTNNILINVKSIGYTNAVELMQRLLISV